MENKNIRHETRHRRTFDKRAIIYIALRSIKNDPLGKNVQLLNECTQSNILNT